MAIQESEDRGGVFVVRVATRAVTTTILGDGDLSAHEKIECNDAGKR